MERACPGHPPDRLFPLHKQSTTMKNANARPQRQSGYTLLELTTVTTTTALVAAILLPALTRARENANVDTCAGNLKKIGVAIAQYSQDADGRLPLYDYQDPKCAPDGNGCHGWTQTIQPYLHSDAVFQCPSEPTAAAKSPRDKGYSDYAYNLYLGWMNVGNANPADNYGSVALKSVTRPAQTVMALDNETGTSTNITLGTTLYKKGALGFAELTDGLRHDGGINYLLVDGHVKWYKSTSKVLSAQVYTTGVCNITGLNGAATFCYDLQ